MLRYNLIRENEQEVLYEYFPEDSNESGLIGYDKVKKVCNIIILSPKDRKQRYALKMCSKIRQFVRNGSFDRSGTMAWG